MHILCDRAICVIFVTSWEKQKSLLPKTFWWMEKCARNLVGWLSDKSLKLLPLAVRFQG